MQQSTQGKSSSRRSVDGFSARFVSPLARYQNSIFWQPRTPPAPDARFYGPQRLRHAFMAPSAEYGCADTTARPLRPMHAFTAFMAAPARPQRPSTPLRHPTPDHAFTAPCARARLYGPNRSNPVKVYPPARGRMLTVTTAHVLTPRVYFRRILFLAAAFHRFSIIFIAFQRVAHLGGRWPASWGRAGGGWGSDSIGPQLVWATQFHALWGV